MRGLVGMVATPEKNYETDVLLIGLSVSAFCAFFYVHLLMILQYCIELILLASQILDSK